MSFPCLGPGNEQLTCDWKPSETAGGGREAGGEGVELQRIPGSW